jgi:hypothetical protein
VYTHNLFNVISYTTIPGEGWTTSFCAVVILGGINAFVVETTSKTAPTLGEVVPMPTPPVVAVNDITPVVAVNDISPVVATSVKPVLPLTELQVKIPVSGTYDRPDVADTRGVASELAPDINTG